MGKRRYDSHSMEWVEEEMTDLDKSDFTDDKKYEIDEDDLDRPEMQFDD